MNARVTYPDNPEAREGRASCAVLEGGRLDVQWDTREWGRGSIRFEAQRTEDIFATLLRHYAKEHPDDLSEWLSGFLR